MSTHKLSPQKLQEIKELAAGWGKIVARRLTEAQGPDAPLDLRTMEQVAAAAATGLTEGTLAHLLHQQAQTLPAEVGCPDCGHLCPVHSEPRVLIVKDGQLTFDEPLAHCPACRRDFFPPPDGPGAG